MMRRLLALAALVAASFAPAAAAINPTINLGHVDSVGNAGTGRIIVGSISFGATDTYVAGGFTITPQMFGFNLSIDQLTVMQVYPNYTFTQVASGLGSVNRTIQITQPTSGASNVAATATTATVTIPSLFSTSPLFATGSPVNCFLNDNAAGGGTGTWSTSASVSTCRWTSANSFTITTTAAAPTGGGNFTYMLPFSASEIATGTPINTFTTVFVAKGR